MLMEIVAPERDPLLYGDNVDVTAALQAGQIGHGQLHVHRLLCRDGRDHPRSHHCDRFSGKTLAG